MNPDRTNSNHTPPVDYSFMRTGRQPVNNPPPTVPDPALDSIYDVGGLLMVFMEDAIELAEKHANHSGRNEILQKDILNGFKVRAVYEQYFWSRSDTLERAKENRQFLEEHNDDIHSLPESIIDNTMPDPNTNFEQLPGTETGRGTRTDSFSRSRTNSTVSEPHQPLEFTKSHCSCKTCGWFWDIDAAWDAWDPQMHYQIILKETVTQIFDESLE